MTDTPQASKEKKKYKVRGETPTLTTTKVEEKKYIVMKHAEVMTLSTNTMNIDKTNITIDVIEDSLKDYGPIVENLVGYTSSHDEEKKEKDKINKVDWKIIVQETSHFTPQLKHIETKKENFDIHQEEESEQKKDTIDDKPLQKIDDVSQRLQEHMAILIRDTRREALSSSKFSLEYFIVGMMSGTPLAAIEDPKIEILNQLFALGTSRVVQRRKGNKMNPRDS